MRRYRMFSLLFVLAFAPVLLAQEAFYRPAIQPADIDAAIGSSWYGLYLKDKKIGYSKISTERAGDNVVETMVLNMKLVSFDKKAEVNILQTSTFEGKEPFRLIESSMTVNDGASKTQISAKRQGKGFDYVVTAGGVKTSRQADDLGYTLADSLAPEVWLRKGPKLDDKILVRSLDLEDWKFDNVTHTLKAVKKSLVGGIDVKFHEIESRSAKLMFSYLSRHDEKGKILSSHIALFELRRETEEQAKNTEYSSDIFVLGSAKVDAKLGPTTRLTELILEVQGVEPDFLRDSPRQSVVKQGKASIVQVGKRYGKAMKPSEAEIKEALSETNSYPISNAKIKELAKKAVGDAKTDEEKVKRIVAFTHGYLTPELIATLPNIHDLLEKKRGDCKCYSLVVTNLCRAAGVPCREVAGLIYMGDDAKAFGGHAWNEVLIGGVWVPIDATLNQTDLDAGHISFGEMRSATTAILQSAGKLSFRLVSATSIR